MAPPLPQIVTAGSRHRLLVDGAPYVVLGAQVRNSSTSPDDLSRVWPQAVELNANTVLIPVAWNRFEPTEGEFDFAVVDTVLEGARMHGLRAMLLWFGTWKNGTLDYAPDWVKTNPDRFLRSQDASGQPVRVLSPHGTATLQADVAAFTALMGHLADVDGDQRTVIIVQVENEPGSLFTVRDHGPTAEELFAGAVPADLGGDGRTTWADRFGHDADETFSAYHIAKYVEQVAAAGKAVYPLPLSVNVWLRERKSWHRPAEQYPSGGPTTNVLDLWKQLTPSVDMITPDIYIFDHAGFEEVCAAYARPDNPLLIPETFGIRHFTTYPFLALADHAALGFAPFGFDDPYGEALGEGYREMAANYAILQPATGILDALRGTGRIRGAVERPNHASSLIEFERDHVLVQWGQIVRHYGGEYALGTESGQGRVIVIDNGDDEYFVLGFDARVTLRPAPGHGDRLEFLTVERGTWKRGNWRPHGTWGGDETFFGLHLPPEGETLRIRVNRF